MRPEERQKICVHCEGRIAVEADTCLYCGMPLTSAAPVTKNPVDSPPYLNKSMDIMKTEKEFTGKFKSPPPRDPLSDGILGQMPYQPQSRTAVMETQEEGGKSSLMPTLLVLLGSTFLTLGLMQGLFSEGGVLRLEWNSKYWFVYCLLAVPMLYAGAKKAKNAKEAP